MMNGISKDWSIPKKNLQELDEQNSLDDSDCVNRCDFEYSASW